MKNLHLSLLITATTLLAFSPAFAAESYSTLSLVKRDGTTQPRVIYSFWSAEYPSPVVDVNSRVKKGTTIVKGHQFVQDLSNPVDCKIKNGLYHPWSHSARSATGYITVTGHDIYRAKTSNDTLNLGKTLGQGTIVSEVVYLSEGFCAGKVLLNNEKAKSTVVAALEDFDCSAILNEENFELLSDRENATETEQYIKVKCEDGKTVFVRDEDMLKAPGVQQGEITGYGSVGPAPKN